MALSSAVIEHGSTYFRWHLFDQGIDIENVIFRETFGRRSCRFAGCIEGILSHG
jgi:hypothetical protein